MSTNELEPWRRLGEVLTRRRIELGFRSRPQFVEKSGLPHGRIVADLESGARSNYDRSTLIEYEVAYAWAPGSIDAVLAGGEPTPIETVGAADQDAGVMLNLPAEALEGLDAMQRREVIAAAELAALERAREVRRRVDS